MIYWATVIIMTRRLAHYEAGHPPVKRWGGQRTAAGQPEQAAGSPLSTGSTLVLSRFRWLPLIWRAP
jgi:hypothetical protein